MFKLLAWLGLGIGTYALLILASRGMTIAFVLTLIVLAARVFRSPKRLLLTLLGVSLLGLALTQLPGTDALYERFSDVGDVAGAGGRVQLWGIAYQILRDSGPVELLLGHGFTASRVFGRRTYP